MAAMFGAFEPDKSGLDSSVVNVAKNVFPTSEGYKPMMGGMVYGASVLPAGCRGLFYARTSTGAWLIFAGTKTKLYRLVAGAWVDFTRTTGGDYNVPDGEWWSAAQFGSQFILCNANDDPQFIDVDGGATAFDALAGTPPKARVVRVMGDFLWLFGVNGLPYHAKWSGLNNVTEWDIGDLFSDEQFFPTGGKVMAGHGDKSGFVLQEMGVRTFQFLPGSDYAYEFNEIQGARGAAGPYSSAAVGSSVFYESEDGFMAIGPNGPQAIGAQRVNTWWAANTDQGRKQSTIAIADPLAPRIYWAAYSTAASTQFDILLIYDWQLDKWSHSDLTAQFWAAIATPGVTLEELDSFGTLDSLPFSLDSRVYAGSRPTFGGISSERKIIFAAGPNMEATLETPESHVSGSTSARSFVTGVYPLMDIGIGSSYLTDDDGNTLTTDDGTPIATGDLVTDPLVQVGARERLQVPLFWSEGGNIEETGWASVRVSGRLFKFRLTMPAGAVWTHALGVDVRAVGQGTR